MAAFRGMGGPCSASIIGDRYLVTAAHCCEQNLIGRDIITGTLSSFGDAEFPKEETFYTITNFMKHDDFESESLSNDICIIQVDRDFVFSERVFPLCFKSDTPEDGTEAFVAGWGVTKEIGSTFSENFREVMVPIANDEECQTRFECQK